MFGGSEWESKEKGASRVYKLQKTNTYNTHKTATYVGVNP